MAYQPQRTDPDVVARSAVDRADKFEAQVKLQAAEIAQLRAAGSNPALIAKAGPLAEQYKGAKTYRLTQRHYRRGMLYEVGEQITVTDERPSKTWVLLEKAAPEVKMVDAPVAPVRPSDTQV